MENNLIMTALIIIAFSIVAFLTRDKKQKKEKSN